MRSHPAYANPRKIRLANSAVGWRLYLYGSSMKRAVMSALVHIRSEDDMNLFMRETAEKSDDMMVRAAAFFKEKARLLAVLDDAGMRLRFATTLFLFGLAALGTLAVGGREMALCALMVCLMLLSAAMELDMSRFAEASGRDICLRSACGRLPCLFRWRIIFRGTSLTA